MLSILIPSYRYNSLDLVENLIQQIHIEKINFEIIVQDDASTDQVIHEINQKINSFENCQYRINTENLGRGGNINSLVNQAQYEWLLILDCDTSPVEKYYIKNYLEIISQEKYEMVDGGISYNESKPRKNGILRWKYGKKRESLKASFRNIDPYSKVLTSNFIIKKKILQENPFPNSIQQYGYEDLALISNFEKLKIKIHHINNQVFHLNLENSDIFIDKTQKALNNLKFLVKSKVVSSDKTSLLKTFEMIKKLKLLGFAKFTFSIFQKMMLLHLKSSKPSIFIFDLYRLGYYCSIN